LLGAARSARRGGSARAEIAWYGVHVGLAVEARALDDDAVRRGRADEAGRPPAAGAEHDLRPGLAQRGDRRAHVVDAEADGVEALAVLVQPACERRLVVEPLDGLEGGVA